MKNTVLSLILFLCMLCLGSHLYAGHSMHPLNQISYVKKKIKEQQEPYFTAYRQLMHYADSIQDVSQNALEDFAVPGFYDKPEEHRANSLALQRDAFAAYCSALAYQLSGEECYGQKACYFLNAWSSTNKKYSEHDGVLVMSYSGSALLMAAELMMDTPIWNSQDKDAFKAWVSQVYRKAVNEIRVHKNNWADWGRFGSLLAASLLDDKEEVARNVQLIKSDLFAKIAEDGHMPEEVVRRNNGIWYTYFSLAPMTAACWLVYNLTGENLFVWEHNGASLKKALDYMLYFHQHPSEWKWDTQPNLGTHETWPDNLLEAMAGIYNDASYLQYVESSRPHIYSLHHFAWSFPTLMPVSLKGYDLTDNNTWANYNRYEVANKTVKKPVAVFMGNSITEGWVRTHPDFFKSNGYIGRGISGLTSYQFLIRFREDVINLSPALVVINAGTNDVAENTQAYNEDYTFGNIVSMAELAKANKIKVILTSVLPAAAFKWRMEIKDVPQKIKSLNDRIEAYAKANKIPFVNYYKAMVVDENQALNPQYTKDGVHPTSEGYDIMEPLIKNAIEKAL